jgi:hypothetical protein
MMAVISVARSSKLILEMMAVWFDAGRPCRDRGRQPSGGGTAGTSSPISATGGMMSGTPGTGRGEGVRRSEDRKSPSNIVVDVSFQFDSGLVVGRVIHYHTVHITIRDRRSWLSQGGILWNVVVG